MYRIFLNIIFVLIFNLSNINSFCQTSIELSKDDYFNPKSDSIQNIYISHEAKPIYYKNDSQNVIKKKIDSNNSINKDFESINIVKEAVPFHLYYKNKQNKESNLGSVHLKTSEDIGIVKELIIEAIEVKLKHK